VYRTLGASAADWMPSMGGEFPDLPAVFADYSPLDEPIDGYDGPSFWKIPQFDYPTATDSEPYVLDMR